jgi:beta-lactamase class A
MMCKKYKIPGFLAGLAVFISCSTLKPVNPADTMPETKQHTGPAKSIAKPAFIESVMLQYPQYFTDILKNREKWNVQVLFTQIDRQANGSPVFTHHYFNVNPAAYFYPASTVKLPIAVLALQKLNALKDKGIDLNSTMVTQTAYSGQSAVFNDPTSTDGRPTIAHYIKKILLVSDNDAYNRLYEFLGQQYIDTEMKRMGYDDVQILHRLNIFLTEAENRRTNPVQFYDAAGRLLYEQPGQNSKMKYARRNDSLGTGYYSGGKLKSGPMDFSKKNRLGLEDLHKILMQLVFPDKVKAGERFNITEQDRQFILQYMSRYPTESTSPPYAADPVQYWATYCKFLFYGAQKTRPDEHIRIFNKPGDAYGHMIDAAYVADYKNKVEFFVSAIIYCNSDGILNDDKYDYDTIGFPFMKNLGRVLYDHELKRTRKIKPDLSPVLFNYDK